MLFLRLLWYCGFNRKPMKEIRDLFDSFRHDKITLCTHRIVLVVVHDKIMSGLCPAAEKMKEWTEDTFFISLISAQYVAKRINPRMNFSIEFAVV